MKMNMSSHYRLPDIQGLTRAEKKQLWTVLGSELSPFTLKVINYLQYMGVPFRFLYEQGNTLDNILVQANKMALVGGFKSLTWPQMDDKDEYPLVPFVFGPAGEALYDSTAIADWFEHRQTELDIKRSVFPAKHDAALNWLQNLIEEFFDDWGLYMVHHNRWKVAAVENDAGDRLGRELRSVMGPLQILAARFFSARQTRRLPYLFSVAPQEFQIEGVAGNRQPPAHKDFPTTHALLEASFSRVLLALEAIFSHRPYLFGDCYSLADASIYGQLGMNLPDPEAARWIESQAPNTYAWLLRMAELDFSQANADTPARWFDDLQPLLAEISRVYLPLMQQNEAAYLNYKLQGQTLFNEAAFWKGQAIYAGEIDGTPFKSVAKSFQVQTWQQLKRQFHDLTNSEQRWLSEKLNTTGLMPAHAIQASGELA